MQRQKMLHDFMQKELYRYEKLYYKLEKEAGLLPKGSLAIDKNGNLCRYLKEGKKQYMVIIPVQERQLILALKKRRYIKKGIKVLKKRILLCKTFLDKDQLYDPKQIEKSLPRQYKGTKGLNVFLDGDIDPQEWANANYKRNPMPIKTPHYTASGICVRSKSEAIIGTRLEERKAIFRCEPEVRLNHTTVYPDFEILNIKRRRLMYLEHLGMIDDEGYVFRNLKKLEDYAKCGIILGDNLFITYESRNRPLQIKDIDDKLDEILA